MLIVGKENIRNIGGLVRLCYKIFLGKFKEGNSLLIRLRIGVGYREEK